MKNKTTPQITSASSLVIRQFVIGSILTLNFTLPTLNCVAQCPDGRIYQALSSSSCGTYQYYDPVANTTTSSGIPTAGTCGSPDHTGLAYGPNLNAASPSPTLYTISGGGNFLYWDGATWVNTGHSAGPCCIPNLASGGSYIYSFDQIGCKVWKYDGTGPATVVLDLSASCPLPASTRFDLATDACGNFFILNAATMTLYSPTGAVLQTYTVSGLPGTLDRGGLAMIGGKIYAAGNTGTADLYVGTISGTTITFAITPKSYGGAGTSPQDFASCPDPTVSAFCVLPIELLSFTGNCNTPSNSPKGGEQVKLQWTTASEINNDYFTIERSSSPSGGGWEGVGTVKGAGNSSTVRSYEFIDNQVLPFGEDLGGVVYYRLKQTDFDGKTETFNSKQVAVDVTECAVQVFPNPAGNKLNVPYVAEQDGEITLQVYDMIGKLVKDKTVTALKGNNKFTLDLTTVVQGLYVLKVKGGAKENNQKFVKTIVGK